MNVRTLSTQELLRLCLESNDQVAWQEFVRRFQSLIAGVVVKTVRRCWRQPTPEEVDDLVHDTYLKLFANDCRALRSFNWRHEMSFFGYLKVVASTVSQDWVRKMLSEKHVGGVEHVEIDKAQNLYSSTAAKIERDAQMEEIWRRLKSHDSGPDFTRDCSIFWLYYRQGLTAKEISELPGMGLSVKGVESVLLRMIRNIRGDTGGTAVGSGL